MLKATFENLAHGELHIIDGVEVFIFTGNEPGPTTGFIAGQHGNESAGPLWLQGRGSTFIDEGLRIEKGSIIVVRCANPEGLMMGSRWTSPLETKHTRDLLSHMNGNEYDNAFRRRHDMNRRWTVKGGVEEKLWGLFQDCSQVIDLHVADGNPMWQSSVCHGPVGESFADAFLAQTGLGVSQGWFKLSDPKIIPEGSLLALCEEKGISAIGLELPLTVPADQEIPDLSKELHPEGFSVNPWQGVRRRMLSLPEQQRAMPHIWQWILNLHK